MTRNEEPLSGERLNVMFEVFANPFRVAATPSVSKQSFKCEYECMNWSKKRSFDVHA